jgi:hypothetical protein
MRPTLRVPWPVLNAVFPVPIRTRQVVASNPPNGGGQYARSRVTWFRQFHLKGRVGAVATWVPDGSRSVLREPWVRWGEAAHGFGDVIAPQPHQCFAVQLGIRALLQGGHDRHQPVVAVPKRG